MNIPRHPILALILTLLGAVCAVGCEDKAKASDDTAKAVLTRLLPLVERDVTQVRTGLPKGAAALGALIDDDPGGDPEGLRRRLEKSRAGVTELAIAKSTFFVFVSKEGVVLRSEADPDLAVGQSLFKEVPGAKAFFEKAGLVEVFGYMHGLRGVQTGGDRQWLVGHQVKTTSGGIPGAFVTGWSFRRYVEFLENDARRNLSDTAIDKKRPIPVVYLFLVQGEQAFGGPVTPDVNTEAVGRLGLASKVGDGVFQTSLVLEGNRFAVSAQKLPALGADVLLVALASVI